MNRAERVTRPVLSAPVDGSEQLRGLAGHVRPLTLAGERVLPLLPGLEGLFPGGGLRRGSTVVVTAGIDAGRDDRQRAGPADSRRGRRAAAPVRAQGATSLALALAAGASAAGSWCVVAGIPDLGLVAAAELGLNLERLALVPDIPPAQWVTVIAALLDAVDVIVVRPPDHVRQGDIRRLIARARERGTVLVPLLAGNRAGGPWAEGTDVRLVVTGGQWEGPGRGDGRLMGRRLEVTTGGRGAANRLRRLELRLPGPADRIPDPAFAGADADRIPDPALLDPALLAGERTAG